MSSHNIANAKRHLLIMIILIDENNLFLRIPTFIAGDPDALPSAKLTEGNLQCILVQMNELVEKFQDLQKAVLTTKSEICAKIDNLLLQKLIISYCES